MRKYITSAHGHELSGCVRADVYNLILNFALYYYAPWPILQNYHGSPRTVLVNQLDLRNVGGKKLSLLL